MTAGPLVPSVSKASRTGTIVGVDIQSGDVRGRAPAYAMVILEGDSPERDVVSRRKLRRTIHDLAPSIVATDNVFELVEDKDALLHFLRELPDGTALVQVTGGDRPEPLSRVASRHGIDYAADPMAEAEAAARLARANVGHVVTAFTERTAVKVARGRSTGKGGWSEDRYTRRIHGAVRRRAREIESTLREHGLDFERDATEKYGGLANAVFTVEARPEDIPISRVRNGDIRVEIERERRDGIEFESLVERRQYVIVGMDPGTTTAVSLVDLDGSPIDTMSSRTADTAAVIEWIVDRGRPFLVAADVTPIPETVEKVRRSFDAAPWTPETDLPVDEKLHRTREVGYDNDHERDAMAAALFAWDDHADQFERIARKVPPRVDRGTVTAEVIRSGESVESVLGTLESEDDPSTAEDESEAPEPKPETKTIRRLEREVERLRGQVDSLQSALEERDNRIEELETAVSSAKREERKAVRERRTVTRLEREVSRLERERDRVAAERDELDQKLERLKELWRLDHDDFADVAGDRDLVPVKPIEQFTESAIEAAEASFGLAPDDVILLRDATGAGRSATERLADRSPRLILRRGGLSDVADRILFEHGIPVAPAETVPVQEVDDLTVANEAAVIDAIEDWEDRAAKRRRERNSAMVDQLISEHRADAHEGGGDGADSGPESPT